MNIGCLLGLALVALLFARPLSKMDTAISSSELLSLLGKPAAAVLTILSLEALNIKLLGTRTTAVELQTVTVFAILVPSFLTMPWQKHFHRCFTTAVICMGVIALNFYWH